MNVEVVIEVDIPPQEKDIDGLRRAASKLTNNPKSITVQTSQADDCISLITNFIVKTVAQYKVIDDIWSEFEFWTFDLEGYQDMSVSFPK
jgi:hypothetical protein